MSPLLKAKACGRHTINPRKAATYGADRKSRFTGPAVQVKRWIQA